MTTIWYNGEKQCELSSFEENSLKLLLPYWGLKWNSGSQELEGALSTFMIGMHGLSPKNHKIFLQLLKHTGIRLSDDFQQDCHQQFLIKIDQKLHMPFTLETPDGKLFYLNPVQEFQLPIQNAIHKGLNLTRRNGPYSISIQPSFEEDACEWLAYLVIQSCLRSQFKSLSSLTESSYAKLVKKVLKPINPYFSKVQFENEISNDFPEFPSTKEQDKKKNSSGVPSKVPFIRPFSSLGALANQAPKPFVAGPFKQKNAKQIDPFKLQPVKAQPIQPFSISPPIPASVIRPFHLKNNTPSPPAEYDKSMLRTFNKRRDGK